jgi:hypothetical protein
VDSEKMIPFILTEDNMHNLIYQTFFDLFFLHPPKNPAPVSCPYFHIPKISCDQSFLRKK